MGGWSGDISGVEEGVRDYALGPTCHLVGGWEEINFVKKKKENKPKAHKSIGKSL